MPKKKSSRPTSPARIAANRLNARKSTGPRTVEGKGRSSKNATKHGLRSRHLDLDSFVDPEELQKELYRLFISCRPTTPEQLAILDVVARKELQLKKLYRIDFKLFDDQKQRRVDWFANTHPLLLVQRLIYKVQEEQHVAFCRFYDLKSQQTQNDKKFHPTNPKTDSTPKISEPILWT